MSGRDETKPALWHVTDAAAWREAGTVRCPPGGFIHLCTDSQRPFVLARHFAGRGGLVALRVAPDGLDIRWEESEPGMAPFPHLFEELTGRSVIGVEPV